MLKRFKPLSVLLLLTAFLLVNCKKDKIEEKPEPEPEIEYPITGLWTGSYTQDQTSNQTSYAYSFAIYPDGTIMTKGAVDNINNTQYSVGTWAISNDSLFSARITTINYFSSPTTQTLNAIYSPKGTLSKGVWANTTPINGNNFTGKFSLKRVN